MADRDCSECFVEDLQKIHRLVEKRELEKLPEEVREPLLEAKRQIRWCCGALSDTRLGRKEPAIKSIRPNHAT